MIKQQMVIKENGQEITLSVTKNKSTEVSAKQPGTNNRYLYYATSSKIYSNHPDKYGFRKFKHNPALEFVSINDVEVADKPEDTSIDLTEIIRKVITFDGQLVPKFKESTLALAKKALESGQNPYHYLSQEVKAKRIHQGQEISARTLIESNKPAVFEKTTYLLHPSYELILEKIASGFIDQNTWKMIESIKKKFGIINTFEVVKMGSGPKGFEGIFTVNGKQVHCRCILAWGDIQVPHYRYIYS